GRLCALGSRRARALSGVPVVRGREASERCGVDELPVSARAGAFAMAAVLSACVHRPPATDPALVASVRDAAGRIADTAGGSAAVGGRRLPELADEYGARIPGSTALTGALEWAAGRMRDDGLDAVRLEPVAVPHWVRGVERARIVRPVERPMAL